MTKMKKITALLLTMVMFFSISAIPASATTTAGMSSSNKGISYTDIVLYSGEKLWIDGTYTINPNDETSGVKNYFYPYQGAIDPSLNIEVVIDNGKVTFNCDNPGFSGEAFITETYSIHSTCMADDGENKFYTLQLRSDESISNTVIISFDKTDNGETIINPSYFNTNMTFNPEGYYTGGNPIYFQNLILKSDISTPTVPKEVETSFMQKVTTDSGQYEMYVSGFMRLPIMDGYYVLTPSGIAHQSINIHVKNTTTNEIRTMTESTIEYVVVCLTGDEVTFLSLSGRVQTPNGTLERYTTTVNL